MDTTTNALFESSNDAVAFSAVYDFVEYIGVLVKDHLTAMDDLRFKIQFQLQASGLVGSVDNISEADSEQTEDNEAYVNATYAVLPHEVAAILPCDVLDILQRHQKLQECTCNTVKNEVIERDNKAMSDLYRREFGMKVSVDSLNNGKSLEGVCIGFHST